MTSTPERSFHFLFSLVELCLVTITLSFSFSFDYINDGVFSSLEKTFVSLVLMATTPVTIPTTQSALQWVRVSDKDPFDWNTSAPVVQPAELGDRQVLLENFAASVNPIDYKLPSVNFTNTVLPACVGFDVSGRVLAVGKGVKDFHIGDEVFGLLNLNSSRGGGAFQQYSVAEVDSLVKKPSNVSHENAAALGVAFLSALVSEI